MKLIKLLFFLIFTLCSSNIIGDEVEPEGILNKLLAPGPLILGHKDLEKTDCLKCHDVGKGISDAKCMECHKEIKKSFESKKGFHGLNTQACMKCHSDHKGPDYESTLVDEKTFDHKKSTGYSLEGKHSELKCNECHDKKRTEKVSRKNETHYFEQVASCVSCHKKDDIHFFSGEYAKKDCDFCHISKTWKDNITFNHDKDTKFKLEGYHAKMKCNDCHLISKKQLNKMQYIWPNLDKTQCLACHQDFHKNNLGSKFRGGDCTICHSQVNWKIENFDHSLTNYNLDGKHIEVKCIDCHKPLTGQKGSLKNSHTQQKNIEIKDLNFTGLKQECLSCHKNPHIGVFSEKLLKQKCSSCHTTEGWEVKKSSSGFNHEKTRFPLTGVHKQVKCSDCHGLKDKPSSKQIFKFKEFESEFCIDCHTNVHTHQFSSKFATQKCSLCHSTQNFKNLLSFDHSKTNYPLVGEHAKIKCNDCHKPTTEKIILKWPNFKSKLHSKTKSIFKTKFLFPELNDQKCLSCHSDYHKGQLSLNCTNCHNEKTWKPDNFNHNSQSRYKLIGKHQNVDCKECHVTTKETVKFKNQLRMVIRYKPLSALCFDCHKDPHKGNLGTSCQECHTENNWKSTKDFHKNFTLTGVHYTLSCIECHKEGKKLSGLSQQCLSCHQKDDVHNGMLPNCKTCHTQHFWEATQFKHSMTKFPLRGAHRTLECASCHTTGIYKGLSSSCFSCHFQDFLANPGPHPTGNTNCIECHRNTFAF